MRHALLLATCFLLKAAMATAQTTQESSYSNVRFAWTLHREITKDKPNDNFVWSPFCLQQVLAVVGEGARGRTAKELGDCLGMPIAALHPGDNDRPWDFAPLHLANSSATKALRTPWAQANQEQAMRLFRSETQDRRTLGKVEEMTTLGLDGLGPYRPFTFRSVDRLLVQRGLPIEQEFLRAIRQEKPEGAVEQVDFKTNPESERLRMNQWIAQQTEDVIKDPIQKGVWKPQTQLVAVNVAYFRADWSKRFNPEETRQGSFYALDGKHPQLVPMMTCQESCRYVAFNRDGSVFPTPEMVPTESNNADPAFYPKEGGYHVIEKTYAGRRASMVLVLPSRLNRLAELEAEITISQIEQILRAGKEWRCDIKLPKFKVRTSASFLDSLTRLGVTSFADRRKHDFTGIYKAPTPQEALCLEDLNQVVDIEVNERGTVAVAVAVGHGGGVGGVAARPQLRPFIPQFIANQAFLYFIKDNETGQILFVGRTTNPLQEDTSRVTNEPKR